MLRGVMAIVLVGGCSQCNRHPSEIDAYGTGVDTAPPPDVLILPDAVSSGDPFASPNVLVEIASDKNDQAPSVTDDQLEIVFASDRDGGIGMMDLYVSTRAAITDAWGDPVLLDTLSSAAPDDHPWIAPDGLTLYFASGRAGGPGGYDLYASTRGARGEVWPAPSLISELNTIANEFSLKATPDLLVAVLDSDRNASTARDVYVTTRPTTASTWSAPVAVSAATSTTNDMSPVLADDGLALYFVRGQQSPAFENILFCKRANRQANFGTAIVVPVISSNDHDLDPWLAQDQRTIYFVRQATSGPKKIVAATR